tara:strand:+ start:1517 stop:1675 length:159 start_codon:yes stop_codon:yes gene_type:complete
MAGGSATASGMASGTDQVATTGDTVGAEIAVAVTADTDQDDVTGATVALTTP